MTDRTFRVVVVVVWAVVLVGLALILFGPLELEITIPVE